MGVKNRAKKRKSTKKDPDKKASVSSALWGLELDEAATKKAPGKRTRTDDELMDRRDRLAHWLESHWGQIGWELKCARTLEDIEKAFQPVATKDPEYFIVPFLRPFTEATTAAVIRTTRKELGKAVSQQREADERRNAQADSVRQAEGAVFELGEQNREQLQAEIKRRKGNLREIKIRLSNKKGEVRKADLALHGAKPEDLEAMNAQLRSRKVELERIEAEYTEEQRILGQVRDRLNGITPDRRRIAAEILAQRKTALDAMEQEASKARRKWEELEKKLLDQEAYFCRAQLLRFIRAKRYAHNPRNLANALAGLPDMSCRRSAARCAKLRYTWQPNLIYRVLQFIEQTWRLRTSPSLSSPVELFRAAITKLPKTVLIPEVGRRENHFRRYLEENWAYLEPAIEEGTSAHVHPRRVPYIIIVKFQENLSKPKTYADILFAQQQKLSTS